MEHGEGQKDVFETECVLFVAVRQMRLESGSQETPSD
jgi:hypothetical protein